MTGDPEPTLVDAETLAKHLGVSIWTIYRLVKDGLLPAHRLGRLYRFDMSEVMAATNTRGHP